MVRADKRKNKAKITKSVIKNPLQSQREIASSLWIWKTTVQEHLQDIKTTKDDRIVGLTDKDFELMQKIQARKFNRMDDLEKPVDDNNLNQWDREAKARYTLFRWDATDDKGWIKENIDNINIL